MRRSHLVALAALASGFVMLAAACSLEDGGIIPGEGVDGSTFSDGAAVDGRSSDSQVDGPPTAGDSGFADAAPDADGGVVVDAGPTFLCGSVQVANCAVDCPLFPHDCPSNKTCIASCFPACAGYTFQCDGCGTDGGIALSRCEPGDALAFAECLSGLNRCACPGNDVSKCPGSNQTCENEQCFECGEPDGGSQVGHQCEKGPGNNCHTTSGAYGACY